MFASVRLFTFQNFPEVVYNYSESELTSFVNVIRFCQAEFKYLRTLRDLSYPLFTKCHFVYGTGLKLFREQRQDSCFLEIWILLEMAQTKNQIKA